MANLDSAWQASVLQLAQSGNLRAIAFWLNCYLVPQGICAQVLTHQSGNLRLRMMCRRPPDRDRLLRFVSLRLGKLNTSQIRQVSVEAQVMGSSELLWEQSVPVRPVAEQPLPGYENVYPLQPTAQVHPIASAPSHAKRRPQPSQRSAQLTRWLAGLTRTSAQHLSRLPHQAYRSAHRSVSWFKHQKPRTRALLLGSSAATAFLLGCGFEVLNHQVGPVSQPSQTTESDLLGFTTGKIKAAEEWVPVIQQPVASPKDPTITLLFGNSAIFGQGRSTQVAPVTNTSASSASDDQTALRADVIMTSIDGIKAAPAASPSSASSSPDATSNAAASSATTPDPSRADSDPGSSDEPTLQAAPPAAIDSLLAHRVNIVNLASEPLMRNGADLTQTIASLQQQGIHAIGAGADPKAARRPLILDVKGKRIAFLAYSDATMHQASDKTVGINAGINDQIQADIKAIRSQVDWVVVSYRWGRPVRAYPEDWQIDLAHFAVDQGADLVLGYDANTLQGGEVYSGRPIVYSLGSSIHDSTGKPQETAALKVTLRDHQMQVEFVPVSVQQGQPEVATGDSSDQITRFLEQASSLFNQPLRSSAQLDARLRLSFPSADRSVPTTAPFVSYPAGNFTENAAPDAARSSAGAAAPTTGLPH